MELKISPKLENKNNLSVHDCTAQKCDAEKCRTGVLEHFDPLIVVHQEDGDEAAQGAEHGDTQEDKSEGEMSFEGITYYWMNVTLILGRKEESYLKLQLYSAMQGVSSWQDEQPAEQGMQM